MGRERDVACPPVRVPAALAAAVAGYSWRRDAVGESGADVYRLVGRAGAPDLYLKHGRGGFVVDVADEADRLDWLSDRIAVPAVRRFVRDRDDAWLLTAAIPGPTAQQALVAAAPRDRPVLVDALTDFLGEFHALPAAACPFSGDRLAEARRRIDARLVDTGDFAAERQGWTAARVWDAMAALGPLTPDPVVTHGDFSLDNFIVRECTVVGAIDVGRAGVADRYQDLAILWDGLNSVDAALAARMLRRYGVGSGDDRKLRFYLLLDELF